MLAGEFAQSAPTEADLATVNDAVRLLDCNYCRFDELRRTFKREWLNVSLTMQAIGRSYTMPRWAILRHIVNHATYHRGQITSKLKRFGIEQPNTDFFFWAVEQCLQPTSIADPEPH